MFLHKKPKQNKNVCFHRKSCRVQYNDCRSPYQLNRENRKSTVYYSLSILKRNISFPSSLLMQNCLTPAMDRRSAVIWYFSNNKLSVGRGRRRKGKITIWYHVIWFGIPTNKNSSLQPKHSSEDNFTCVEKPPSAINAISIQLQASMTSNPTAHTRCSIFISR